MTALKNGIGVIGVWCALLANLASAQTVQITPELAKVIEAAKKEGSVRLWSNSTIWGGAEGAARAQAGINKMFGTDIKVEWSPGSNYPATLNQVYQEKQAGQKASTDVIAATPPFLAPYLDKGLFATVDWASLMPSRISPKIVEADKRALQFVVQLPGILYNVKSAQWVAQVESLEDVLKPEFKGKFATTPFLSAFDVLLAKEVWGVEKTREFVKALSTQVSAVVGCENADREASGEIPALVLDCTGTLQNAPAYRGRNVIDTKVLRDSAQRRYAYMMIAANAEHPNAAILFTLFISSSEGQNLEWDSFGSDLDTYPDSKIRPTIEALQAKGYKFIDVTIDWWVSHPGLPKDLTELVKLIGPAR